MKLAELLTVSIDKLFGIDWIVESTYLTSYRYFYIFKSIKNLSAGLHITGI